MFFYIAMALLGNGNGNRPHECSKELASTLVSDARGLQNRIDKQNFETSFWET